jgi:hypothetical protein
VVSRWLHFLIAKSMSIPVSADGLVAFCHKNTRKRPSINVYETLQSAVKVIWPGRPLIGPPTRAKIFCGSMKRMSSAEASFEVYSELKLNKMLNF